MNQSLALLLFGLDTLKWHLEDFSFNWPVQGLSRAANNGSCFPHHVPDIDFNQLGPAGASNHTDSVRWAPRCVFLAIFYKLPVAKPGCSAITTQIKHSCHCAMEIWSRPPRLTRQWCRKCFFSLFYAETQSSKGLCVSVFLLDLVDGSVEAVMVSVCEVWLLCFSVSSASSLSQKARQS